MAKLSLNRSSSPPNLTPPRAFFRSLFTKMEKWKAKGCKMRGGKGIIYSHGAVISVILE